jgi:hypothetical protein
LFRSFAHPKTLTFALLSVVATTLGCSRMPGEPDDLGVPWNANDIAIGRCVGTCSPDYGPEPITLEDCARAEAGLEFFPVPVWDWEPGGFGGSDPVNNPRYGADDAYSYQDGTTEFLMTNAVGTTNDFTGDGIGEPCTAEWHAYEGNEANCQAQYGMPVPAPVDRCGSTGAMHLRGGPFREWGGGLGIRLDGFAQAAAEGIGSECPAIPLENPDPSEPAFCPEYSSRIANAPGWEYYDTSLMMTTRYETFNETGYYLMQVDLREWEGISFWARRGPDSQPGFRVVLGDLNLDDDASFIETQAGIEPTCRRAKECDCRNHRTCTRWSAGYLIDELGQRREWNTGFYCAEPSLDLSPYSQMHPWNHEAYRCDVTACNYRYAAYPGSPDAPFWTSDRTEDRFQGTASCNTWTFDNDITRKGCFDPNGQKPPESADRCGDPWIAPVRLSSDWEFYQVPFTDLRQEGYGKEFPATKLSAITMVRFTWHVGWADFWIDDVRFYRKN